MSYEKSVPIRFWSKVDVRNLNECWEWKANRVKGYGQFKYLGDPVSAHRVAWILSHNKEIPEGKLILHKCDNKSCCNPSHLYCGTQSDNMADREHRNPGKSGRRSRLGGDNILLIRSMYKSGNYTQKKLAAIFSISEGYVSRVINCIYGDHTIKLEVK